MGRLLQINAVGTAGEDDAHRRKGANFVQGGGIGLDLTVDVLLPNTPGNELVILTAEIKHQNFFFHISSPVTD